MEEKEILDEIPSIQLFFSTRTVSQINLFILFSRGLTFKSVHGSPTPTCTGFDGNIMECISRGNYLIELSLVVYVIFFRFICDL
jgi:hypothetical protein